MARIVVIDDDPDMRQMVGDMLDPVGHAVTLTADAREGIRQCQAMHADMVITDIYMPGQDGLETILELRRLFPGIGIIAISGRDNAEVMLSVARHLGAGAILQKPFERERLVAAVHETLAARLNRGAAG